MKNENDQVNNLNEPITLGSTESQVSEAESSMPVTEESNIESINSDSQVALTLDPNLQTQSKPLENKVDNSSYIKPKNKVKVVAIILVLLIVAAIAFISYQFFVANPQTVYKKIITKYTTSTEKYLKGNLNSDSYVTNGSLKIDSNIDALSNFKNISFDYTLGMDLKNNNIRSSVDLKENSKTLLDGILYMKDNKAYLKSDSLINKILYLGDFSEYIDFSSYKKNYEDISYLVTKFNDALIAAISKADYDSQYIKLNIDGKEYNVIDNIMIINKDNIGEITKTLLLAFKNDSKSIEIISRLANVSQEEINDQLEELINTDYSDIDSELRLNVYTQFITNRVIGFDIVMDNEKIFQVINTGKKIKATSDDYEFVMETTDKKHYDISIKENNNVISTGKLTIVNDNEINFETSIDGINVNVTLKTKLDKKVSTSSYTVEITTPENNYLKVSLETTTEYDKAIETLDTANAVNIENLSDEDYETIINNFQNNLQGSALYDTIEYFLNSGSNLFDNYVYEDYPEACYYATCSSCNSDTCTCTYTDTSFNTQTITCPNENAYY